MRLTVKKWLPQNLREAASRRQVWLFAANEWHRLYHDYVPYATGTLANTVKFNATANGATITHIVPYAHRLYNGEGFDFRRDLHPMAASRWDQRAKARIPQLCNAVQRYIDEVI